MTIPPPKEWRDGTLEQQAAYQGWRDAEKERDYSPFEWMLESKKAGEIYAGYFEYQKTNAIHP